MVLEPDAVPLDAALFDFLKPIMEPYEYVIIDASSVGRSSDVLRLNKLADHALFVVRHDAIPLSVIQDAIEKLKAMEKKAEISEDDLKKGEKKRRTSLIKNSGALKNLACKGWKQPNLIHSSHT